MEELKSVLTYKKEGDWYLLPSNESCEGLESAINSYYEINFCGCGDRLSALEILYKTLNYCERWKDEKDVYTEWLIKNVFNENEGVAYFILYTIENLGFTGHGSSVGGSWLTDKGKMLYNDLKELFKENDRNN